MAQSIPGGQGQARPSNTDEPERVQVPMSTSPALSSATSPGDGQQLWILFCFSSTCRMATHLPTLLPLPTAQSGLLGQDKPFCHPSCYSFPWVSSPHPPSSPPSSLKHQLRQPHDMGQRNDTRVGEWVRPPMAGGDLPGGLGHPRPPCLCWGH